MHKQIKKKEKQKKLNLEKDYKKGDQWQGLKAMMRIIEWGYRANDDNVGCEGLNDVGFGMEKINLLFLTLNFLTSYK